jgi:hypothetical protein
MLETAFQHPVCFWYHDLAYFETLLRFFAAGQAFVHYTAECAQTDLQKLLDELYLSTHPA